MTQLQRFREELTGATLVTSPQNTYYLSRFAFEDGYLLVLRDAAYLLTDFRYKEAAMAKADRDFTVLCPDTGLLSAVNDLLHRHGEQTLTVEESHVTLAFRDALSRALSGITVTGGASARLAAERTKKSADELAVIERAQALTDAAFTHILDFITPSRTEREVALELELHMRRNGADGIAFDTIAVSGSASALPHGVPRDCVLEKGFLTMDFGARLDGYCSDMTRTVVIGHADEQMRHLYHTVLAAQEAALAAAREGVANRALDSVARDLIHGAGYEGCFGHSLGHGVGIDVHEAPGLSQRAPAERLLTRGDVVTVEPGIYIEGKYGCRIEDMIAVCEDGSIRNLTKSRKDLIELCR